MRKFSVLAITSLSVAIMVAARNQPNLKDAFQGAFLVGAAVNAAQFTGADARGAALIAAQFNSITPENVLKWEHVHPKPGVYDFDLPDRYVAFGEQHHMWIIGHTLIWHNQTPAWVFQDDHGQPVDRATLLECMHDHIRTVVGRYKGRINGWDVVNEALNEDGTLRQSPWLKIIGEDYIAKAFEFAHEADPKAELYYNDYSLENNAKRDGAVALIRKLQAEGVPVAGIGLQGHVKMDWPSAEQEDAAISTFAALGIRVNISELDVDVLPRTTPQNGADVALKIESQPSLNPYLNGLPDNVQEALTQRYADLFGVFLKHRADLGRVTFWGVTDGDSWLNGWPVRGRTNYPLLFDRRGQPKPAFDAVVGLTQGRNGASEAK